MTFGKKIKTEDDSSLKIPNNKVIDGTFTTRRKHPKRNIKTSGRQIIREEKRKIDIGDVKVKLNKNSKDVNKPVLQEKDQQSNKKQILWKTENIADLDIDGTTIADFKDETFVENYSESEGDSNIKINSSTDISKIENIDEFAKVIDANDEEGNLQQRTVIIKNIPGALRLFGIKNVPRKVFQKSRNPVPRLTERGELNLSEEITQVFDFDHQVKAAALMDTNTSDKDTEVIQLNRAEDGNIVQTDTVVGLDIRQDLRDPSELEKFTLAETPLENNINNINITPQEDVDKKDSIGNVIENDNDEQLEKTTENMKIDVDDVELGDILDFNSPFKNEVFDPLKQHFPQKEADNSEIDHGFGVEVKNRTTVFDDTDVAFDPLKKLNPDKKTTDDDEDEASLVAKNETFSDEIFNTDVKSELIEDFDFSLISTGLAADEVFSPLKSNLEISANDDNPLFSEDRLKTGPPLDTLFYEDFLSEAHNITEDNSKLFFLLPGDHTKDNSFRFPEDSNENSFDQIEVLLPSFDVNINDDESFLLTKSDIVNNFKNRFFSNEIVEENDGRNPKSFEDEITHDNWVDPSQALDLDNARQVVDPNPIIVEDANSITNTDISKGLIFRPLSETTNNPGQTLPVRFEVSSIKSNNEVFPSLPQPPPPQQKQQQPQPAFVSLSTFHQAPSSSSGSSAGRTRYSFKSILGE